MKSDREGLIPYDIAYVWNGKKIVQMNLLTRQKCVTRWLPLFPPPTTPNPPPAVCCSFSLPLGLSAPLFAQPPVPGVSPKLILPLTAGPPFHLSRWQYSELPPGGSRDQVQSCSLTTAGAELSQLEGMGGGGREEKSI